MKYADIVAIIAAQILNAKGSLQPEPPSDSGITDAVQIAKQIVDTARDQCQGE